MKKLLALSIAAIIFSFAASAQTERPTEAKGKMERHKGRDDKEKMMKELNLTKEQKAQMKANHQDMKAKNAALKAQDNITVKEMREKKEALKTEQKSKMEAVLTADQKTKFAEIIKQKKADKGNEKKEVKRKNDKDDK